MEKKSIAKNYIYNLLYQILILILPLITTPYVSRTLGAEGIGIYSFTISIVTYFILFGSLGIAMYGQREIAYLQTEKDKRSKTFIEIIILRTITLSISMLVFYFTYGCSEQYGIYYKILMLEIFANIFDISWFFQGLEEFKKTVTRNLIVKLISVILTFLLVKTANDLWIYLLIYVGSTLIGNVSLWFYLPRYISDVNFKELNVLKHLKPTIGLFIPQIAMQIYTVLDKTMIGVIARDISEVGYYEQAQKIVKITLALVTALGTVMAPRMANTFAQNDKKKINEYMDRAFKFVWFLAIPIMFGVMAIAKTLVPWFYGEQFESVKTLLIVISPIILAIGLNNISGVQYLIQTKQQNIYTITVVIGAIVNFILNMILIPRINAVGAAIASVVAEVVIFIVQLYFMRKVINIFGILKLSKNYVFAGVVMLASVSFIGNIVQATILGTIIQIMVGGILYVGILLLLRDEFLYSNMKMILEKVKRK